MNSFKKNIYRGSEESALPPTIGVDFENSSMCYSESQITILVQNPTDVSIAGTFNIGGSYETSSLTGINQITSNFSETITVNTTYNFGIDAGIGSTQTSGITITAVDTVTGDTYNYTLSRNHANTPC